MKARFLPIITLLTGLTISLAGCGGGAAPSAAGAGDKGQSPGAAPDAPVTINIVDPPSGYLDETEFQKFVVDPVKKRYPNITIQKLTVGMNEQKLQEMVTGGQYPDLIVTSSNVLSPVQKVGFATNIERDLKEQNFDLGRFEPGSLQAVKTTSGGSYLSAVPYATNISALYYNRDIFDKFGVAYPKDGMTWGDAAELAKKVTRLEGGVQFYGLQEDQVHRTASQLGLGYIDPKTMKPIVNSEKWKYVYQTMLNIYSIPGNAWIAGNKANEMFYKDKVIAMYAANNRLNTFGPIQDLNWDIATYPTYKEAPGTGMNYDLHVMVLTANSQHKKEAIQVISTLTSDEVQSQMAKDGRISVMKDTKFQKDFGQNLPYLKNKNLAAIFKVKPAANFAPTEFDAQARSVLNAATSKAVFEDKLDINTALRQADEQINQLILSQ
ncbi:MAG: extracellular solute-binding protein family 1 [Paenibacillaceae bacterium]|jgi:multiple sugar transport system substrate-binding protein|nr:extracellular solute-binding protein family 1 [Paenibacillaceae bacterium]